MIVDRGLGQSIPNGSWDAVFYQATHDSAGLDIGFASQWALLKGKVRGAYHFANPAASSGTVQATLFVARVKSQGWDPTDLWMLDVEVDGLSGVALANWIDDFMAYATTQLGDRGFLYIGWPFYVTHISHQEFTLLHRYRWWVPAYGPNDGHDHGSDSSWPVRPVLHQFTSVPFDTSSITDPWRWNDLFNPGVIVHPRYDPPLALVDICSFTHPDVGPAFAGVQADGAVFCPVKGTYLGGANGKQFFRGLTACEIAASPGGYTIKASNGKLYAFPTLAP